MTLLVAAACSRKKETSPVVLRTIEETATDLMQRALQLRKQHAWSEAIQNYQAAKQLAPDDPDVHRGVKLFERLAPFLEPIRELDARIAVTPEDDQLLCDRALLFLNADDNELALTDSEAAAQKADWAMRPRLFRAIALNALERNADAASLGVERPLRISALPPEFLETISRLDAEISLERDDAELYVQRAWQLNEIGQPRLALEDAESALRLNGSSAGAHMERGYALAKLGRADEGLEELKRATEIDANLSLGWQYRGELELARGDYHAAIESLDRAVALDPTSAAQQKREQAQEALTRSGAQ